jgi:triosephosphate isomerase
MPAPRRLSSFIAGNWKMYKGLREARRLAEEILAGLPPPAAGGPEGGGRPRLGLFPNAVALSAVAALAAGRNDVLVGAQNIHFEPEGAFTGEISAEMVLSAAARGVLLGHSERRHIFGETDATIGKKVLRALAAGLTPVLCVGETLAEREGGETRAVVRRQLSLALEGIAAADDLARITLAYEPVWAIGTGKTATPAQGEEVHAFLRSELEAAFGRLGADRERARETRILYGGSVKPANAAELLAEPDIDGLLVGGASLEAGSFLEICRAAL